MLCHCPRLYFFCEGRARRQHQMSFQRPRVLDIDLGRSQSVFYTRVLPIASTDTDCIDPGLLLRPRIRGSQPVCGLYTCELSRDEGSLMTRPSAFCYLSLKQSYPPPTLRNGSSQRPGTCFTSSLHALHIKFSLAWGIPSKSMRIRVHELSRPRFIDQGKFYLYNFITASHALHPLCPHPILACRSFLRCP